MTISQADLEEVVRRLAGVSSPSRVIVFGSVARGAATDDSDLDLLVLFDDVVDTREESVRLRAALGGLGVPIDLVVMRTERFEETKDVIGGLAYPAHKYGRIIYETA